ncbi:hypothetical protein ACELLULO517_07280 [Acidisoma cellulosilytica]|uniref:Lipoprotein n=1 Tax=Acidisoma cellulosilyticum TaxID=2802395 RepID=A0A963YZZ4_9PROT|nr:hypothetical protein [Acidisoma cellulosilyticum]MCB8880031.1 hypothetical protein [Acidisoma cellulosilyticum]
MRRLTLSFRYGVMALPLALAACGDFPQPMMGHPGRMGAILAHPPPQRLVIPVPMRALLDDKSAAAFAGDMADALAAQTVPAMAQKPQRGDWVLGISATMAGNQVTPTYTVFDPRGHVQGRESGQPVPSQAWADGDQPTLTAEANDAGPKIANLLSNIDAALKENDPNSLYNRPPQLDFSKVTGAPGDGDTALAREMTKDIGALGVIVVDQKRDADYLMRGQVKTVTVDAKTQRIEIYWIIDTSDGKEIGRVAQLHDIPKGSLDSFWGDVAVVAAQQAAGGVKEVLDNNIGKRAYAKKASPAPAAGKPAAGGAAGKIDLSVPPSDTANPS